MNPPIAFPVPIAFVPGTPAAGGAPLAAYRPPIAAGAVDGYVRAFTRSGDLVLDLFCHGPRAVYEAVQAGRRALGLSANPIALLAARVALQRPSPADLTRAFTHLADSLKGDQPLQRHVTGLYRTRCPACGADGIASAFTWDREANTPYEKTVRCPACGDTSGPTEPADVEAARRLQARGLAYYYALDRAAPPDHPARPRAEELLELYTGRNLRALIDLTLQWEALAAPPGVKAALAALLLEAYDRGSSLYGPDAAASRPHVLRAPVRFVERNVWDLLEQALAACLAEPALSPVPLFEEPRALLAPAAGGTVPPESGLALAPLPARSGSQLVAPGSVSLLLVDPPRPDGVFWALSALWANWLWESPAVQATRPLLRRRRFEWDWHQEVLQEALAAAAPLLAADGRVVSLFCEPDPAMLASVCLAASGAGYRLEGWGYAPEVGHRLVWSRGAGSPQMSLPQATGDLQTLQRTLAARAAQHLATGLQARGEPAPAVLARSHIYASLAGEGSLPAGKEDEGTPSRLDLITLVTGAVEAGVALAGIDPASGGAWWLESVPGSIPESIPPDLPVLADRIERAVWELLLSQPAWDETQLIETLYTRFSGILTPELALVRACIESYAVREGTSWRLREEDEPRRRAGEVGRFRSDLERLGQSLGFQVIRGGAWDLRWREQGGETGRERDVYLFVVSATAELGRHLLAERPIDAGSASEAIDTIAQPCLVLPGGRAAIIYARLQRDGRLQAAVARGNWQFVKFRQLRQLLAEPALDLHALKTVLGLDPIAERPGTQIPLL